MKIGYMKFGRSWKLDPANGTTTGGDLDVARALHMMSRLRPNDEIVLVGRNSGERPQDLGYPVNVTNPWTDLWPKLRPAILENVKRTEKGAMTDESVKYVYDTYVEHVVPYLFSDLDAIISWAGQHGTSNSPIPQMKDPTKFTNPQDAFTWYCSYQVAGLNHWRDSHLDREETWLCPDPRNYMKARDIKWPIKNSFIAQYDQTRKSKHERYGDPTSPESYNGFWEGDNVWVAPVRYTYDALELTALPSPSRLPPVADISQHANRYSFGMLVNENRAYVAKDRLSIMQGWVLEHWPEAEIFGNWSKKSIEVLQRPDIRPCPYEHLPAVFPRWRSTLTTPASGSGWATAKPWECFAYGTVCFFHPDYDTQGHILRDADPELRDWLLVTSAEDLKAKVARMDRNPSMWANVIAMQRLYFEAKYNEHTGGVREILRRLPSE